MTVEPNGLTGDSHTRITREVTDHRGDILDARKALKRTLAFVTLTNITDRNTTLLCITCHDRLYAFAINTGGAECIYTHLVRPQFHRPGFRKTDQAPLSRHIG